MIPRDQELRASVREAYSAVARSPRDRHAFPVGAEFAASLGYPEDLLRELPAACVEAFTGVSNVSLFADIPAGETVLDAGCGAGLDALIAARRSRRVIGVDFSPAMLARARCAAPPNILFCQADAERLPLADQSVGVALANGIFNLNPARERIFRELARVVRFGGAVYAAELILTQALPPEDLRCESNWFA